MHQDQKPGSGSGAVGASSPAVSVAAAGAGAGRSRSPLEQLMLRPSLPPSAAYQAAGQTARPQRLPSSGRLSSQPPGAFLAGQPGDSLKPMPGRVASAARVPSRRYSFAGGLPGGSEQQGPVETKPGGKALPCWLVIVLLPLIIPAVVIVLPFTLASLCCCPPPPTTEQEGSKQAGQQQDPGLARKTTSERLQEHNTALAAVDAV